MDLDFADLEEFSLDIETDKRYRLAERPAVERPGVSRSTFDRPAVDRPAVHRSAVDRPVMDRRHVADSYVADQSQNRRKYLFILFIIFKLI